MGTFAYLDVHEWSWAVVVSRWEEGTGNKSQFDNRAWFSGFFTGFGSKMLQGMRPQEGACGVTH